MLAAKLRHVLAIYEKNKDLISLGAYHYGSDPKIDYAIDKIEEIESFLKQRTDETSDMESSIKQLIELLSDSPD